MKIHYYLGLVALISLHTGLLAQAPEISYRPQLLCIDNNEACALADVNNDGQTDIIAGRLWYPAPDFVPHPLRPIPVHPPDYAKNHGEHAWDVDQDGWIDAIASGWGDGKIYWYKNPGGVDLIKGLEWKARVLADTKITSGEAAYMKDMDGDGIPEYIINSWDRNTPFSIWRLEYDEKKNPIMVGATVGPYNSHGVGFGDVNGDGRIDILFDEGWYEQPESDIWRGNWKLHKDWKFERGSCPYQVVDVNDDGKNDIIWGKGHDYGLYWMEQGRAMGDSTTWTQHVIDESWSQVHAMNWADMDGDGEEELIAGKRIWAHSGKDPGSADPPIIFRYVWSQEKQTFDPFIISTGKIGTGLFIRVADLNSDKKPDIVVAGKTGTYILWQE